ncbi:hypothetical protein GX51_03946 [Blastomyces parvus]|uniref:Protein YAE1 n=1 Tax=Blastomyces parvus TaxID=2060905 RepID=A0A2B7X4M0_9EURO|nr:hypothetical protein GX51_03946 [Blastomyces parvus]
METSSTSHPPSEQSRPSSPSPLQISTPPSPSTTVTTAPSSPIHQQPSTELLDDIFGASPPNQHQHSLDNNNIAAQSRQPDLDREPSDLPFLRRQHVTAGYRDGISIAKGEHVQRGFDGGFPVGAELGLRVGTVLGVLEGLAAAAAATRRADGGGGRGDGDTKGSGPCRGTGNDIAAIFETAKKELSVQNVFGAAAQDDSGGDIGGAREWVDPCVRLAKAGDEVVTRWEGRVRELLAATS